jgi:hypothetical protein
LLLRQLVAQAHAVELRGEQAQLGAGRQRHQLLAHRLDLADHLEALLQALLGGPIGGQRGVVAGDVGIGGRGGGGVFGSAVAVDRGLQPEVFGIERRVGRVGRKHVAVDLGFQAHRLGAHAVEPFAGGNLLRLGEGRIEGGENSAGAHIVADADIDRADDRGLERLHHHQRIDGDQLAARGDDAVDPGERRPQDRADQQRRDDVDDAARGPRQPPLINHGGVGLERHGGLVDALGRRRRRLAERDRLCAHRNDLLCFSHSSR